MSKQSRASIKYVLRWITSLDVEDVLIENVREFKDWGPLHRTHSDGCQGGNICTSGCHFGRPIQARKGEYFQRLLNKLRALGYRVDHRILCAADYGDATTRQRLFIRARKDDKPIVWPEPSHAAPGKTVTMFESVKPWRTAREILDLNDKGESIFNRKRPLSPNTLKRIYKGLEKFSGLPFIVPFFGEYEGKSPRTHAVDQPLPTVTSHGAGGIVQPYLVKFYGQNDAAPIDGPLPTVTEQGGHIGVATPFVMAVRGGDDGYLRGASIDDPLPTITASPALALVEAQTLIVPVNHGKDDDRIHQTSKPFPTITSVDAWGLAQYLVEFHGGENSERRVRSIDEPMPTLATQKHLGLLQPFIVKFYKSVDGSVSIDEPLPTATGHDRFGLCVPLTNGYAIIDIFFRMVKPMELARAHSMDDFKFQGTREEVVKQIGNSVPRRLAKALCLSALS